jgi:hypothetical protein
MSKRWKPKYGETFWYVSEVLEAEGTTWEDDAIDLEFYKSGNCFYTVEEAEAAAEKVKVLLLSLHDNGNSIANSETLKGTFTEYLKKCAELQLDILWHKARENRLSEQYHNGPEEENTLPDWVEVGEYVYDDRNGYGKIVSGSVKSCYIEFDGGAGDFVPGAFAKLKQARLRPYNADEMKALVGKVIEGEDEISVITDYSRDNDNIYFIGGWSSADEILNGGYTIDGEPCGVLEHLENGEWVH